MGRGILCPFALYKSYKAFILYYNLRPDQPGIVNHTLPFYPGGVTQPDGAE